MATSKLSHNSDEPDDAVELADDGTTVPSPDAAAAAKIAAKATKKAADAPVPLTKARKKASEKAGKAAKAPQIARANSQNPVWLVPLMLTLLILGLVWIVLFYLTSDRFGGGLPLPWIRQWNIAVGFGLILAGGIVSTQYK